VQHQPISSDSKKLDDILKKKDRMGKRLDLTASSLKYLICPALEISTSLNYLHFSFCRLFFVGLGSSILKKKDRMGKRLDTLERSEKAPEKETSNTQYNGGYRGGNRYNPKRYGRGGGYQNHRGDGDFSKCHQVF
jgi:hypothetical protein